MPAHDKTLLELILELFELLVDLGRGRRWYRRSSRKHGPAYPCLYMLMVLVGGTVMIMGSFWLMSWWFGR